MSQYSTPDFKNNSYLVVKLDEMLPIPVCPSARLQQSEYRESDEDKLQNSSLWIILVRAFDIADHDG
jgi:hypothetical protein